MPSFDAIGPLYTGAPDPIQSATQLYQAHMFDSATQAAVDGFLDLLVARLPINLRGIVPVIRGLNNGQGSPHFSHIDRHWFALEMALRLRQPSLVSQNRTAADGMNLCGPNMAMLDFAAKNRAGFIQYGVSLFETGEGLYFSQRVRPSPGVLSRMPTAIHCADYILLASLRDSPNAITNSHFGFWENIRILTKPGLMVRWLEQAGYTVVLDRTWFPVTTVMSILNALTPHSMHERSTEDQVLGLNHLRNLAQDLQDGRSVFLLGSVTLGGLASGKINTGEYIQLVVKPRDSMDLHWMLVQHLQVDAVQTTFRLHSYGNTPQNVQVPTQAFLWGYNGFVSGDPSGL